jgi:hypothetical protein
MEDIQEKVFRVHFKNVGNGVYPYLNIPVEWARKNKLKKGDSLLVTMDGDLHITPFIGHLIKKWKTVRDIDRDDSGDFYINDALYFRCPDCRSQSLTIQRDNEYRLICHDCGARYRIELTDEGIKKNYSEYKEKKIMGIEIGNIDNGK